jgi:hypothetical protein
MIGYAKNQHDTDNSKIERVDLSIPPLLLLKIRENSD